MKKPNYLVKIGAGRNFFTHSRIEDEASAIKSAEELKSRRERVRIYHRGKIVWGYLDGKRL